jgi:hypothetical protein
VVGSQQFGLRKKIDVADRRLHVPGERDDLVDVTIRLRASVGYRADHVVRSRTQGEMGV